MSAHVQVRPERCIGSGLCVSERPDLFRFNADGISEVYGATEDVPDAADDVIAQCPVGALERADV